MKYSISITTDDGVDVLASVDEFMYGHDFLRHCLAVYLASGFTNDVTINIHDCLEDNQITLCDGFIKTKTVKENQP